MPPLVPPPARLLAATHTRDPAAALQAPDDSPVTARAMVLDAHRRWLAAAGASVEGGVPVEISPLASYGGEGLAALAGRTFAAPTLIAAAGEDVGAVAPGTDVVRL